MRNHDLASLYIPQTIVLVGMMATGKTTVGKRLAKDLNKMFWDSDQEVEKASGGHTVSNIYNLWGQEAFRMVERNVIKRLLKTEPAHILSTGEGAFLDTETRALLLDQTIVVWLKSDIKTLANRLRRKTRPQFDEGDNVEEKLALLMQERYPIYSMADICVESDDECYQDAVDRICVAVKDYLYPDQKEATPSESA